MFEESSLEAVRNYQRVVRSQVLEALERYELRLPHDRYNEFRRQMMSDGAALSQQILDAVSRPGQREQTQTVLGQLGLGLLTLPRIVGFGMRQAQAVAESLNLENRIAERATRLGALFNLGIVLFDLICDQHPALIPRMLSILSLEGVQEAMETGALENAETEDAALNILHRIVSEFFQELKQTDCSRPVREEFQEVIRHMYDAEVQLMLGSRASIRATRELWIKMRNKSALPMWTVALTTLHFSNAAIDRAKLNSLRRRVYPAGALLWIMDDLADAGEDWMTRSWSRSYYLLFSNPTLQMSNIRSVEEALQALVQSGVVASEIRRAAQLLRRVQNKLIPATAHAASRDCFPATVLSWVYALPE